MEIKNENILMIFLKFKLKIRIMKLEKLMVKIAIIYNVRFI